MKRLLATLALCLLLLAPTAQAQNNAHTQIQSDDAAVAQQQEQDTPQPAAEDEGSFLHTAAGFTAGFVGGAIVILLGYLLFRKSTREKLSAKKESVGLGKPW